MAGAFEALASHALNVATDFESFLGGLVVELGQLGLKAIEASLVFFAEVFLLVAGSTGAAGRAAQSRVEGGHSVASTASPASGAGGGDAGSLAPTGESGSGDSSTGQAARVAARLFAGDGRNLVAEVLELLFALAACLARRTLILVPTDGAASLSSGAALTLTSFGFLFALFVLLGFFVLEFLAGLLVLALLGPRGRLCLSFSCLWRLSRL